MPAAKPLDPARQHLADRIAKLEALRAYEDRLTARIDELQASRGELEERDAVVAELTELERNTPTLLARALGEIAPVESADALRAKLAELDERWSAERRDVAIIEEARAKIRDDIAFAVILRDEEVGAVMAGVVAALVDEFREHDRKMAAIHQALYSRAPPNQAALPGSALPGDGSLYRKMDWRVYDSDNSIHAPLRRWREALELDASAPAPAELPEPLAPEMAE